VDILDILQSVNYHKLAYNLDPVAQIHVRGYIICKVVRALKKSCFLCMRIIICMNLRYSCLFGSRVAQF
jgi:hypothetical protein